MGKDALCQREEGAEVAKVTTRKSKPSARLTEAFAYARSLHTGTRKGSDIPYLSHLMAVCALVLEHGGTEVQAIAALLHDAAEDEGGESRLVDIRHRFGGQVARIVRECSDALPEPGQEKPDWRPRKEAYLEHLKDADEQTLLVSAADKVHNARSMLDDYRRKGESFWVPFNSSIVDNVWYYTRLADILGARLRGDTPGAWLVVELRAARDGLVEHAVRMGHARSEFRTRA